MVADLDGEEDDSDIAYHTFHTVRGCGEAWGISVEGGSGP